MKESVLQALKAAGSEGYSIQELAKKLKVGPNNLYRWFYTTGRKIAGLKKSGRKYIYTS